MYLLFFDEDINHLRLAETLFSTILSNSYCFPPDFTNGYLKMYKNIVVVVVVAFEFKSASTTPYNPNRIDF